MKHKNKKLLLSIMFYTAITMLGIGAFTLFSKPQLKDVSQVSVNQKPYLSGICLRNETIPEEHPLYGLEPGTRSRLVTPVPGVDASILFVEWADIQKSLFGPLVPNNVIDQAIKEVEDWNAENPNDQIKIRLRVLAGIHSPKWVSDIAGSVTLDWVNLIQQARGASRVYSVPRFWTPEFREAWEDVHIKLAAAYDSHPLIGDVSIAGSGTLHSEFTWRQYNFPNDPLGELVASGLTFEKDVQNWKREITFMMETWEKTPVEATYNFIRSYDTVLVDGVPKVNGLRASIETVEMLMDYMASESKRLGGKRYMIGNHSVTAEKQNHFDDPNHVHGMLAKSCDENNAILYIQTQVNTAHQIEALMDVVIEQGAVFLELPNDITNEGILAPGVQRRRVELKRNLNGTY